MMNVPTAEERTQIERTISLKLLMIRQALLNLADAIEYQPARRTANIIDLCSGLAEVVDDIYNDFDRYTIDD